MFMQTIVRIEQMHVIQNVMIGGVVIQSGMVQAEMPVKQAALSQKLVVL